MNKKEEIVNNRIREWDNLKFLLIFLVVLGHILERFMGNGDLSINIKRARFYIYIFHMPLFIFISGMFSKKNIDQKRYYNIFFYLILFYVTKIILFVSDIIINKTYSFSMFTEKGVPWYCFAIFIFSLMTIYTKRIDKKYVLILSLIMGCIIGYDKNVSDFLVLSRIFVFYPFFFAGYCLDGNKILKFLNNKWAKFISLVILITSMVLVYVYINKIYWLSPLLSGRNPYFTLKENYYLGGLLRLVYYIIVPMICASIIALIPSTRTIKFFANLGTRTIQVYVLHYVIIQILFFGVFNPNIWMKKILPVHYKILILPIALIITILLSSKFLEKIFVVLKRITIPKENETKELKIKMEI